MQPDMPRSFRVNLTCACSRVRQTRFPSWCAGPCGCTGANKTQPDAWQPETNESGAVTGGALSCPDAAVDEVLHLH